VAVALKLATDGDEFSEKCILSKKDYAKYTRFKPGNEYWTGRQGANIRQCYRSPPHAVLSGGAAFSPQGV
jgi:hypothetical protein